MLTLVITVMKNTLAVHFWNTHTKKKEKSDSSYNVSCKVIAHFLKYFMFKTNCKIQ